MPITLTDIDLILIVTMLGAALGLIVFFLYMLVPFENRIKFTNKLTRKNNGVIEVATKGNEIDKYIVNFDKRIAETQKKVFFLDPDYVYRKFGVKHIHFNELDALDPVKFAGRPKQQKDLEAKLKELGMKQEERATILGRLKKREVTTTKGDKKMFLFPVSYSKLKPKEEYKNPEMIKGVFMEQKALASAQALFEDKMFRYMLMAAAIGGALAFVSSFMLNDKFDNQVLPAIEGVSNTVSQMADQLNDLEARMNQATVPQYNYPVGFVFPNGTVVS